MNRAAAPTCTAQSDFISKHHQAAIASLLLEGPERATLMMMSVVRHSEACETQDALSSYIPLNNDKPISLRQPGKLSQ